MRSFVFAEKERRLADPVRGSYRVVVISQEEARRLAKKNFEKLIGCSPVQENK